MVDLDVVSAIISRVYVLGDRRVADTSVADFCSSNRWLLYRFDAIGALTTYTAILLVLYTKTSAALGGMVILSSAVSSEQILGIFFAALY